MRSLLFVLGLTACVSEERGEPTRFVGTIEGSNALVFVVADPTLTSAYACDGTTSPAMFEWFTASTAAQMTATSDANTAEIAIDLDTRSGTLTSGAAKDFTLVPVELGYGLYRGTKTDGEDTYEVGIILLDDDRQNGTLGITSPSGFTTIVTPRIVANQTLVTLLNDVTIPIANALNAYSR
jgi:hypothetical protein